MLKLLVIDDDEELCAELRQVLETEGFEADMTFDGQQGLRYMQENQYHIIILDLKLPRLNGYDVLKSIRNMLKPVKVLVLSGRPMGKQLHKEDGVSKDEEEKALSMADAVMNKPFMVENLIQKIKELSRGLT